MIEMARELMDRDEERSAFLGMGIGASIGKGRVMAKSAGTHPEVPGATPK